MLIRSRISHVPSREGATTVAGVSVRPPAPFRRVTAGVVDAYERVVAGLERVIGYAERRYTPLGRFTPGPFQGWDFLWQPAVGGFVAFCLIVAGGSFPDSPFKLDLAGVWFFGEPRHVVSTGVNETMLIVSVVLGYSGLVLLMRVWLRLVEVLQLHSGAPLRSLWRTFALWATPMALAAPFFSRDVFSYAAQGEMTSYHLNPYVLGPFALGSSPYVTPVDPLWGNAPAPYGPFFLTLDGSIDRLARHNELATVIGLRVLEIAAVILLGWGVASIAGSLNRDRAEAVALAVLNPITLITLVNGAHNDALMAGLLVAGVALALRRRPLLALVLIACAGAVKAPALLGVAFVGWVWWREGPTRAERHRRLALGALASIAPFVIWTYLAGFGWGWVGNLMSNGAVQSWAAPVTALGLGIGKVAHALGWNSLSSSLVLRLTRGAGLLLAITTTVALVWHSRSRGWVHSLGVALVLFAILGPVVQPWYFIWGISVLAASYVGRQHFWILIMSVTGPFAGLPGGRELLSGLLQTNPLVTALAVAVLGLVLLIPMGSWTQWSWPEVVATTPQSRDPEGVGRAR